MNADTKITIYTKEGCSYCVRAKQLLEQKNIEFSEIRIDEQTDKLEEMISKADGQRTVPQIFIGDMHVGGFDDLWSLETSGQLDKMLVE